MVIMFVAARHAAPDDNSCQLLIGFAIITQLIIIPQIIIVVAAKWDEKIWLHRRYCHYCHLLLHIIAINTCLPNNINNIIINIEIGY